MAIDPLEKVVYVIIDRAVKMTVDRGLAYIADYIFGESTEELIQNNNQIDGYE